MSSDCFGGSSIKLQLEKKGKVIWPSVAMLDCFGRFVAMFFGGFLDQITDYDRKKKVQSSGHRLECCLYLKRGFLDQITNYDWKKRYSRPSYSSIAYTICNKRNILFLLCLYLKRGNKLNIGIV
jgi:hypothetical protein